MRSLASAAVFAAFACSPAFAQDVPDMLGTWTPQADFSARVGANPGVVEHVATPTLNQTAAAFAIRIDAQDGRAFHGMSISPGGKEQRLVGVFQRDGRHFMISTETGGGLGEMTDDGMETCWSDAVPEYVAVACTSYTK